MIHSILRYNVKTEHCLCEKAWQACRTLTAFRAFPLDAVYRHKLPLRLYSGVIASAKAQEHRYVQSARQGYLLEIRPLGATFTSPFLFP